MESAVGPRDGGGGAAAARARSRPRWVRDQVILLVLLDALAAGAATGLARVVRFGTEPAQLSVRSFTIPYGFLAVAIIPTWIVVLALTRCYDVGPFGTAVRSRQVVRAGANFLAVVAVAYFVLHVENLHRGFLSAAVPLAMLFSLILRKLANRRLRVRRRGGAGVRRALIVGSRPTVAAVVRRLGLRRGAEITPAGACVPEPDRPFLVNETPVPVFGNLDDVLPSIEASGADILIFTGSQAHGRVQRLTWALEGTGIDVFVVPALAHQAVEIDVRPVAGLPLVYVDQGRVARDIPVPGDKAKASGEPGPLSVVPDRPDASTPADATANGSGVPLGDPVNGNGNGATDADADADGDGATDVPGAGGITGGSPADGLTVNGGHTLNGGPVNGGPANGSPAGGNGHVPATPRSTRSLG